MTNPLIFCAIDTADLGHACKLAAQIGPATGGLKIGLQFFSAHGPAGVKKIMQENPEAALFLDLKFHDIPNTAAGAVRSVCENLNPAYLTLHAAGGEEMMTAARKACAAGTRLLAVTVLTSLDDEALERAGQKMPAQELVQHLALLARECGLDGVVCSAHEIEAIRRLCGSDFTLVVPGIRPAGAIQADQKRIMTPKEAVQRGATHLVIGRPITASPDPVAAAKEILEEIAQ